MKFKQQMVASARFVKKTTIVPIFFSVIFVSTLHAEYHSTLRAKIGMSQSRTDAKFSLSYDESALRSDLPVTGNLIQKNFNCFFKEDPTSFNIIRHIINDQDVLFKSNLQVSIPITGKVLDSKGQPLPGVTVRVKGTDAATATDTKGEYKILAPSQGAILIFTFLGFERQEVIVGASKIINITLKDQSNNLNEVVVVAFGSQRAPTVTGSIATINTKDLVQSPVANISNSLVGRMPGVFASQASGEPGSDQSTIRIRGVSTFSGKTDPLIMVDGIENANYNNIDPNEIESVSVLKDASATAVYGIRGANGVILITTKRGKTGPPRFNYTFNEAINHFTQITKPMDAPTYAIDLNQALANDAYVNSSLYVPRFTAKDIQLYKDGTDPIFHPNINWYDVMLKKYSYQQQHNLNVSGGSDKVKYFVSAGYFNQGGLIKDFSDLAGFDANLTYSRINFRANLDFQVNKRLKITVDASSQNEQRTGTNANTSTVIDGLGRANPIDADLPIDGKIVNNVSNAANPITGLLSSGYKNQYSNYLNATVKVENKLDFITPGLNFRANVNYQNFNSITYLTTNNGTNSPLLIYTALPLPNGGVNYLPSGDLAPFGFSSNQNKNRREILEFGFDYDKSFGGHNITGLLLYRQSKLYDPTLAYLVPNGHQGAVGRVTYNYKSKYLAEVSAGYEGTENFAPGKRFGLFPAYSIGWVPSEESFFPKNNVVNFVKFKASYGQVGNDQIGGARFLYNPTSYTYGTTGPGNYFGQVGSTYQLYQGVVQGAVGNPDLTWERSVKINAGIDIYMFNNTLTLKAEVFHEKRNNILEIPQTSSLIPGYLPPAQNLGSMQNQGIEGSGTYSSKIGQFNYQIAGNISFARNKILFESEVPQTYSYRNVTGQRLGQYYGLVALGLFNTWAEVNDPNRPVYYSNYKLQPGDIKFKDINGDGVINDDDKVPLGYSNVPEITYGFSLRGSYKGFDISFLFQGVSNVSLGYTRRAYNGFYDTPSAGAPAYLDESWTADRYAQGLPIKFPRFTTNNGSSTANTQPSSMFIVNGQYLRLKNAEIGYTFRSALLKKVAIKSARVFANGNNLITWDHILPGIDPENLPQATNLQSYPLVRTINIGINVGF